MFSPLLVLLAVLVGSSPHPPQPQNPALAHRIESLFDAILIGNDARQESAAREQARKIYAEHGFPTIAEVGDLPSYEFVVMMEGDTWPFSEREAILAKVKAASAEKKIPSDAAAFYEARLRLEKARDTSRKQPPSNPALRDEIERMVTADQAVRQKQGFDVQKLIAVDAKHVAPLKTILNRYGVPTYAMVGPDAASDFIILLQHQSAEFRQDVLSKLKANVDAGQADPQSYAMMYDKSQRDLRKPQFYGEALECAAGEQLHLAPMLDPDHVDERRANVGLLRLQLYVRLAKQMMPSTCAPAATAP